MFQLLVGRQHLASIEHDVSEGSLARSTWVRATLYVSAECWINFTRKLKTESYIFYWHADVLCCGGVAFHWLDLYSFDFFVLRKNVSQNMAAASAWNVVY